MTPDAIDKAATAIADNRMARTRLGPLPESIRPADLHDAYAVQERMNVRLSEAGLGPRAGYKIGCTTSVMQQYMNIHEPALGEVFADTIHRGGHARLRHGDYVEPGVESEIAVELAADLPAAGAPWTRESVRDAVGACMTSVELVDARYVDFRTLDTPTMAADNFFNAALILGEPVRDWQGIDLAAVEGRMTLNGEELGRGPGSLVMGHPLEALAWLANRLAERGRHLKAGEVVTLGSVVETKWVAQGDRIEVTMAGLGSVRVDFE